MSETARWAVLGAGVISGDFLRALPQARLGALHAVGARDAERAREFADEFGGAISGTYDEILARDDVDAVYIGTVHTSHRELTLAALAAGKAVLCEKPLGISVAETEEMIAAAEAAGLPLVEAFKYRFGPLPERVRELVAGGELGEITEVETSIGFAADRGIQRLFDPKLAGGAMLDAGCYPVSFAVGVAAWAGRLGAVSIASADGTVGVTGVDEDATAEIDLGGIRAHVATSITRELPRAAVIRGTAGELEIPNVWGSRVESTADAVLRRADGTEERVVASTISPMAAEADATISALREGRTQAPEMPWFETLATARLLAEWRAALD
ncbi:MAG: oxidoreductase [Microbacterium sp. SCN 70-200]|uniref:Gfo/Idh/MocA family protein n=1 Tax=unclassified Microbacterium TaxID=2609290 RepID=UPI000869F33C|nr:MULTISPECIES: Gfo/Idh/MocA family oxidoreductase [unclassified Microbacterium]MBN9215417.1 Gfo/Idh/MocA family oxidoreductase [Microbacterium sp.]ODT41143.1 MAG: oxidoreductase [Microbacterium sp. SCN 70-200]OJV79462.1 MAG: oxidoreductase [Microbacterium sp. 70-16]